MALLPSVKQRTTTILPTIDVKTIKLENLGKSEIMQKQKK